MKGLLACGGSDEECTYDLKVSLVLTKCRFVVVALYFILLKASNIGIYICLVMACGDFQHAERES